VRFSKGGNGSKRASTKRGWMAELSLRRVLIKNTGVQMAAHGISTAIGLATMFVLSRYLGVEGFGQYNYIFAFFYLFITINDFGVNTIVVREVSKQRERERLLERCSRSKFSWLSSLFWLLGVLSG